MTCKCEPSDWHYLSQSEVNAVKESLPLVGEYIESLGKTDLAEYTKEELETILLISAQHMVKNSIPF
jgi:hypothetical protein